MELSKVNALYENCADDLTAIEHFARTPEARFQLYMQYPHSEAQLKAHKARKSLNHFWQNAVRLEQARSLEHTLSPTQRRALKPPELANC